MMEKRIVAGTRWKFVSPDAEPREYLLEHPGGDGHHVVLRNVDTGGEAQVWPDWLLRPPTTGRTHWERIA